MPPASRNQRAPTAGEIPAPVAARSLDHPAAINAQNRCWSSRRAVLGRPGERSLLRPDRSDCRLIGFITTPSFEVLRPLFESTQYTSDVYKQALDRLQTVQSMSEKGECWDNAVQESFFATLKTEMGLSEAQWGRAQTRTEVFEWIEVFYNRRRRHSSLGYRSPTAFEEQAPIPN